MKDDGWITNQEDEERLVVETVPDAVVGRRHRGDVALPTRSAIYTLTFLVHTTNVLSVPCPGHQLPYGSALWVLYLAISNVCDRIRRLNVVLATFNFMLSSFKAL